MRERIKLWLLHRIFGHQFEAVAVGPKPNSSRMECRWCDAEGLRVYTGDPVHEDTEATLYTGDSIPDEIPDFSEDAG